MRQLGWVAIALLVTVCAPAPQPSPVSTPPAADTVRELPTSAAQHLGLAPPQACAGIGLAAVLRGGSEDPRLAWLERIDGRGRLDVVWPRGYLARFAPDLEVLDETGRTVIRDGDFLDGACVTGEPDVLAMSPPFMALRLDCGPVPLEDCTSDIYEVATAHGWPEREIAEVHFLTADGRYRILFEDGTESMGSSSQP